MYIFRFPSSMHSLSAMQSMVKCAKSGWPVSGQKQVNSGIWIRRNRARVGVVENVELEKAWKRGVLASDAFTAHGELGALGEVCRA